MHNLKIQDRKRKATTIEGATSSYTKNNIELKNADKTYEKSNIRNFKHNTEHKLINKKFLYKEQMIRLNT